MTGVWDAPNRLDRLHRSATAAALLVVWIIVVGVGWRQLASGAEENVRSVDDPIDVAQFGFLDVPNAASVSEIQDALVQLGVDPDLRFTELIADPTSLRLPPELDQADALNGLLAPGRYPITPTTDAAVLLERMAYAFVEQVDLSTRLGLERRGVDLVEGARQAGLVGASSTATAQYPVAATLAATGELPTAPGIAAVGADALAAVASPVTLPVDAIDVGPSGPTIGAPAPDPAVAPDLQRRATTILDGVVGRTSFVIAQVGGEVIAANRPNRVMESASVYKLAVLAVAMDEIEAGRLSMHDDVAEQLDPQRPTGPVLVRDGLTVREAMRRMIVTSDNPSAEALLFGLGPDLINDRLRSWDIAGFNVGSRPQIVTAGGVAQLLDVIADGRHHEPASTAYMLDLMRATPQGTRLAFHLDAPIAHKTGDLEDAMNDAAIMSFGQSDYVVVVLTDSLRDRGAPALAIAEFGEVVHDALAERSPVLPRSSPEIAPEVADWAGVAPR